ncbi:MAG TPA: pseudouridine synthase [Saprospiraceae bacterium]|nr:pseudouridine synthase [Saprospiraceae bacterium]
MEDNILRLNKFVAHCGVTNRRKAMEIIKAGEISINNVVELNPFYELKPEDIVTYKGKYLEIAEKKVYLLLNKPKNMPFKHEVASSKPDIAALMKKKVDVSVTPIDALSENSAGLVILTNDKELIEKFKAGERKIKKVFQVSLDKKISEEDLLKIRAGIELNGKLFAVQGVNHVQDLGENEVGIEVMSGTDEDIVQLFATLNYEVQKLDRTFYGGMTKKDLKRGWSRFLTDKEVIFLKHFG